MRPRDPVRPREHAKQIRTWLEKHPSDRIGASAKPVLSNRTDNESAKISTDKGVVQGYHSEANLAHLEGEKLEADIADRGYRERDERNAGQDKHKAKDDALWDKSSKPEKSKQFRPSAFKFADDRSYCICPAAKQRYLSGGGTLVQWRKMAQFVSIEERSPWGLCRLPAT